MSNPNFYLTPKERNTIVAALELAVEQYKSDADAMHRLAKKAVHEKSHGLGGEASPESLRRLCFQFQGQADDCRKLIERD